MKISILSHRSNCIINVYKVKLIMQKDGTPTSSRVAAAKTMIETGIKAIEIEGIQSRLVAIERQIKTRGGK